MHLRTQTPTHTHIHTQNTQAKKLGYQGSLKECVVELKSLRKVLEIDLEGAKGYLKSFASLDAGKTGRITYDAFITIFNSKDTDELRTLFSIMDIKDRGSLNFAEFLTGIALLNEQGTDRFDGTMRLAFKARTLCMQIR
jgi:Ca2+-binding EF-hand superfamily protein